MIALVLQTADCTTRDACPAAPADALAEECRTIVGAGLMLQHDGPRLAQPRHMLFQDRGDAEFL